MTKVFIVRPFGNNRPVLKKGKNDTDEIVYFDFDKVESDLILPAMAALGLKGGTTGIVFESGDIREDMFSELLLADIVIADITIHNANVFYELGIRHALRDKRTILIKCSGFDETPFDIIGYRYIAYDRNDPAKNLPALTALISDTMDAERKDSPVFNVLPFLKLQDPEHYISVPADYIDEVSIAKDMNSAGKLNLLANEAEDFPWKYPALRMTGEALYCLSNYESARLVWEEILRYKPDDTQANDRLATIYQRLAEMEMTYGMTDQGLELLSRADHAIDKVIDNPKNDRYHIAEIISLKARNEKTRWLADWSGKEDQARLRSALQSQHLDASFELYKKAFEEDINHYYSGINALGLISVILSLAERDPGTWGLAFDTEVDAARKLEDLKNQKEALQYAVQFSVEAAKNKNREQDIKDIWLNITEADLLCMISTKPERVALSYEKALSNATTLNTDSVIRQLRIYEALGVMPDNVRTVLARLPEVHMARKAKEHFILFTGHMIDKPGRPEPRFPASMEGEIKEKIKERLIREKARLGADVVLQGLAGGACGGDILFHEACIACAIPSRLLLALPAAPFKKASVNFAGIDWTDRFDQLYHRLPHLVLTEEDALPKWLNKKEHYGLWSRANLWMLNSAMVKGGMNMTLIALWNGKGGDGPGGTEHMIKVAGEMGARTIVIEI